MMNGIYRNIHKNTLSFEDLKDIFESKAVVINEGLQQNCDFLIIEMCRMFPNTQILSFYQSSNHYLSIFEQLKCTTPIIITPYDNKNPFSFNLDFPLIIDNSYSYFLHGGKKIDNGNVIYIFRAGSFQPKDLYLGQVIVELSSLKSGISNEIDGFIKIFDRENVYKEMKYKIRNNFILCIE
ncbi:hypothetical protein EDEG_01245 [Edhazardia aedis USNM 41457]|uniref:Uncharacterized protein n=1 Tax=Edhazardia aedis (strain USNM 41457) TaxID=1003232 RepID=J9DTH0_EDHAE|nr:hypothetical protein EDEG_01245 [Edhazardia aedis USNM 41457]|eukprot:EJW04562.1 hypothetical protein EDEG_01245 [Edhazardia aedis USNM 41457]